MAFALAQSQRDGLLAALFESYHGPHFSVRMWDGWQWTESPNGKPACTIAIETPKALAALVTEPNEVTLGEAFIHKELNIEGDIFSVFSVAEYLLNRPRRLKQKLLETLSRTVAGAGRWLKEGARHSMARDRASIAYHYDQPVEFFRPWLGESLAYSCAYFRSAGDSIDRAQAQKLEMICRKLRLNGGERFLDIGCGWGSLILRAAGPHRTRALGITLSKQQAEVAKHRIEEAGLSGSCAVELRDYRQFRQNGEAFDKIASIGMYEHVGLKNLACYFGIVRDLLKPGGVFLNHGIARFPDSTTRKDSFIDQYVFPDGKLVTLTETIDAAQSAGLEVRDVENLRDHYALTLRHWVERLQQNAGEVRKFVDEATYRIWLLYMAGSSAAFSRGDIGVYQVLLSRPDHGRSQLPLVREDWYATPPVTLGAGNSI
ncbi:MAG TPA: cyclopropane-fatty-acyl-phospholipid synthase family protein [Terracidiphilus sp.]|nr:cyclopropane-fatty-acyl-phospholipid synthase family protein [Terracidiphilus sp.]